MNINDRIAALRQKMVEANVDAYIIPSSDPHQSEYVANHWKVREWISGFTGSAGTVVVTHNHAGVWTDSRYFLQGEQELASSEFELHKMYNQFKPQHIEWLCNNLKENAKVGINGYQFSKHQASSYGDMLEKKKISIESNHDLITDIWKDRHALPLDKLFQHDVKFCGKTSTEKLSELRKKMTDLEVDHHLITTLDDIAWLFNIRGNDVEFNPVVIAYALISNNSATLYINPAKVPSAIVSDFQNIQVNIRDYNNLLNDLSQIHSNQKILVDHYSCNVTIYDAINCEIINGNMPTRLMKAIKNSTEINHLKEVMIKDGVAIAKTLYWLENNIDSEKISEYDFAEKLALHRSQEKDYYGESFPAIIGYKGNGAIIHYRPMKETAAQIKSDGILLADSGGQYLNGTTDITRTFALSDPSDEAKDAYTRVLKGHIGLAKAKFPEGTIGGQLDILARLPLWEGGLNYLHGTGHGVGFFLNVHEAPQGFTAGMSSRSNTKLVEGMYTSNEPGYYKTDAFGIRIENLIVTVKDDVNGFLRHDTITLYPIDTTLINKSLMTKEEINWLNDYHEEVNQKISPHLEGEMVDWFKKQCEPI